MAGETPDVSINPSEELEFVAPVGKKYSKTILTVTNNGDKHTAFKVKTTSPKRYCVRPSCGIIQPKQTVNIEMSLLAKEMEGMAQGVTSDKFLIQTMPCNPSFDPKAQKEEFRKQENSVRDDKLRVRLTDPRGHSRAVPDAAAAAGGLVKLLMVLLVLAAIFYVVHRYKPEWTLPVIDRVNAAYLYVRGRVPAINWSRIPVLNRFLGQAAPTAGAVAKGAGAGASGAAGKAAADAAGKAAADAAGTAAAGAAAGGAAAHAAGGAAPAAAPSA